MKSFILVAILMSGYVAHSEQPGPPPPKEPGYCETYEDDCERDNDEDGRPDNEEDDGRP